MADPVSALQQEKFSNFLKNSLTTNESQIVDMLSQFSNYQQLLIKYNDNINLISHNDLEILWVRHYLDSLIPIKIFYDIPPHSSKFVEVIDIGSGAGFPGMPICIAVPNARVTLVESIQKKVNFLLELKN